MAAADAEKPRGRVGLFATCIVDAMRPEIGFASAKLLDEAGYAVDVPYAQSCCGQPAYNEGDDDATRDFARLLAATFAAHDYLVAPSGSCVGMIKKTPDLFDDPAERAPIAALAAKSFELCGFLEDVAGWRPTGRALERRALYHHSCSGLRQLAIHDQPLALLGAIEGLALEAETAAATQCCGFGGAFCVKHPAIADAIVADKTAWAEQSGAGLLLGGDLGCLLHIDAALRRAGSSVETRHVAEALAGQLRPPGEN